MKKGVRDGTGTLRERNGCVLYEGEWKGDKPHGYGKKFFPRTHDRHEGSYSRGERHGLGIYLWANGDKYSGDWDTGKALLFAFSMHNAPRWMIFLVLW